MNLLDMNVEDMTINDIKNTFYEHGNMEVRINYLTRFLLDRLNAKIDAAKENIAYLNEEEKKGERPFTISFQQAFKNSIEVYEDLKEDVQAIYDSIKEYDLQRDLQVNKKSADESTL